jgi:hypothetical protein
LKSGNVESLCNALVNFNTMKNSATAAIGRAAREWIENDFVIEKYSERLQNLYGGLQK